MTFGMRGGILPCNKLCLIFVYNVSHTVDLIILAFVLSRDFDAK